MQHELLCGPQTNDAPVEPVRDPDHGWREQLVRRPTTTTGAGGGGGSAGIATAAAADARREHNGAQIDDDLDPDLEMREDDKRKSDKHEKSNRRNPPKRFDAVKVKADKECLFTNLGQALAAASPRAAVPCKQVRAELSKHMSECMEWK